MAVVIGAAAGDLDRPQIWLDLKRVVPLRLIARDGPNPVDVRLLGYGTPATAEVFPRTVEILRSGALELRLTAEEVERDVPID